MSSKMINTAPVMMCDASVSKPSNSYNELSSNVKFVDGPNIKIKKPSKKSVKTIESVVNETTEVIRDIIEKEKETQNNDVSTSISSQEKSVLSHLGEYLEEPYKIIESYFGGQHLERLVRHQIESYNHFINFQIQRTIQMFNPVTIHSEMTL